MFSAACCDIHFVAYGFLRSYRNGDFVMTSMYSASVSADFVTILDSFSCMSKSSHLISFSAATKSPRSRAASKRSHSVSERVFSIHSKYAFEMEGDSESIMSSMLLIRAVSALPVVSSSSETYKYLYVCMYVYVHWNRYSRRVPRERAHADLWEIWEQQPRHRPP